MSLIDSRQELTALCEQAFREWTRVNAILLFGSRANGTSGPESDWDIAVIMDDPKITEIIHNKYTPIPPPFAGYSNLDVLTLTPTLLYKDMMSYGTIAQQIAQYGERLIGDWSMNQQNAAGNALIQPQEWAKGLQTSLNHIDEALNEIKRYKQSVTYDLAETNCRAFIVHSQDAAEFLVKTFLKRRKVPPKNTHNIAHLAQIMRSHRPEDVNLSDWKALADRVGSLNGSTIKDHQAGYFQTYILTEEDIRRAADRLSKTFILLIDEVESALHPHIDREAIGLSESRLGDERHQDLLKKGAEQFPNQFQSLLESANTVFMLPDTSKTSLYTPVEDLITFLPHMTPFEQVFSRHFNGRTAKMYKN
ncbi:MAG: nucleotidyltransferase domain-containing protein [Aestuariivita sp.]|nr:nucleotidyltransferase domain-containing protein [Aestuariivita sp.]